MPPASLVLELLDLLRTCLQLGPRDAKLLLGRVQLAAELLQFGLQGLGALGLRLVLSAKRRIAFAKDGELVDLLEELGVLSLRSGFLNCTFAFLRTRISRLTALQARRLTSERVFLVSSSALSRCSTCARSRAFSCLLSSSCRSTISFSFRRYATTERNSDSLTSELSPESPSPTGAAEESAASRIRAAVELTDSRC